MRITRCSAQTRQTLREFYADMPAMLSLLARLEALGPEPRVWGLTSLHTLYLLREDRWDSPWLVGFLASDHLREFRISYLLPESQAPWPGARVEGTAPLDEERQVKMILTAMNRSGGWSELST